MAEKICWPTPLVIQERVKTRKDFYGFVFAEQGARYDIQGQRCLPIFSYFTCTGRLAFDCKGR